MPENDEVIERDVVLIEPDLSGFRRKLLAKLKKEMTPPLKATIELEVKGTGLRDKVREAVAAQQALRGQPTYKVELRASRTGFIASARAELKKVAQLEYKVKLVADGRGVRGGGRERGDNEARNADREARRLEREAAKAEREANKIYKRLREAWEVVEQDELRAYAHLFTRFRDHTERMQAAEVAAYREEERRKQESIDRANAETNAKVAAAERELEARRRVEERATAIARREAQRRRNSFNEYRKGPPIIDFGGKGIRPMNLLLGAVTALTPALFAMSANAVQAATSLTALGSAGIGAALGIGGVVTAFQGLGDVLSLRKQVQNEALTKAANVAVDAKSNLNQLADATADYRTALREERRAEEAIHVARREAARDLDDLRRKVVDLNNEYRSNQLSVREAEENERSVNRNFFATATERLRAHQDTLDARTRLGDTALQRRQAQEDLRESIKKGVTNADKVINAQDAYVDAKRRRQQAGRSLQNLRSGADAAAVGKVSSAAAQLKQKLKEMAPAAQDIYWWFDRNEKKLKEIQRGIAQEVLPGFYRFLEEISRPVQGRTTIQVFADAMGELGAIAGRETGRVGRFMNTSLFRKGFDKIQKNNAEGFQILGDAAVTFMRPLTRILAAASPLFPKMAKGVAALVDRFDKFIARTSKDGSLGKWFEDAYESGRKWMSIAGNLLRFLSNIFKLSLPTGTSLVDRLMAFTDRMANWSGSPEGIRQITRFFEFFRDLPYDKIREFITQAGALFAAKHIGSWAKANPFFAAIGLIATSNPGFAIDLMSAMTRLVSGTVGLIADHPEAAATLLAILSAAKLAKAVNVGLSLPGLSKIRDMLTSKFKVLDKFIGGGATTGTMTVHAGVVNVYGKTLGAGGGTTAAGGKKLTNATAVGGGLTLGALLGAEFFREGYNRAQSGDGFYGPLDRLRGNANPDNLGGALNLMSPAGVAGYLFGNPDVRKFVSSVNRFAGAVNPLAGVIDRVMNKGKEDFQFGNLKTDIADYKRDGGLASDPAVVNRAAVKDYIEARKKSVELAVENAKATKGEAAAERVREYETRRSVDTLRTMLVQYGWAEQKADAYARAIYGLNAINEKQRITSLAARDAMEQMRVKLGEAGRKATVATAEMAILSSKLDELDGNRTITVTINGQAAVFKNLETALIYQRLLETGQPATQGNIAKHRAAFEKQSLASGGRVRGSSPHPRADNIPAMLTANEYVQPVDAVRHYGVGFMEAVRRKQLPKFADGGQVWPFKVGWPAGTDQVFSPYSGLAGVVSGSEAVAEIAEATARRMGATTKQMIALIAAGLVESGMRNLNYGDRDSVGFLQQRPSQGWGSVKQLMNPAYATRKFIQAARRVTDRGMSPGALAQAVQRSATPYAYGPREADAVAILNRNRPFLAGYEPGAPGFGGGVGASRQTLVAFGRTLQKMGYSVSEHPAFGGVNGGHVSNSWHYRSGAIDVNRGAGTSAREQAYLRQIIPMARRLGLHSIFMSKGHYDHAHFDIGASKYDSGGILPPGFTLAYNGTGKNEVVRTAEQERALTSRVDSRDIARLIAALSGNQITMDGRKVAEVTNRYNYLPAGV